MNGRLQARLLCGAAVIGLMSAAGAASAAEANFAIPPQSLASALSSFSEQSGRPVLYRPEIASAKVSPGAAGEVDAEVALNQLLAGTGLTWQPEGDTFLIVRADADPQSGSAAGDGAEGTVEALIVTAQKREEDIQDVPIAISAFSQDDLTRSQIAGGPDLMTQVPNFTFTKTNFTGYSIQIRGIGTQAISATTDAAVAVAFNNTPFIRNRFFEQEFYDLQRIEVLRGPQGTLYGRNATAGVVNIISAKPKFSFEARASADLANYNSTRIEGMVNIPLVEDIVAMRLAGAWTKRDGYAFNGITGQPIDGRDLWSTRLSLRFAPTDRIDANLIWEHFEEDDDRIRSGKQLCKTHITREVLGYSVPYPATNWADATAYLSQGCEGASFYSPESFQTPNGASVPYNAPLKTIFLPAVLFDPYVSRTQSRDLRVIESTVDPDYRAQSDVVEIQASFDVTDALTLASETAYSTDTVFSLQDYNRFNTASGAWEQPEDGPARPGVLLPGPNGGIFCDPQIGCSDRLVLVDLSKAESTTFSQEFRLGSAFDGPMNFSIGANFLRYDTEDKYYVFINSTTMMSAIAPFNIFGKITGMNSVDAPPYVGGVTDNVDCLANGLAPGDPNEVYPVASCTYIDPNPIDSLNDLGHNYFLSKNPYKLISHAAFGEIYYNLSDALKVTGGFRFTVDKKEAPLIPSWLLAAGSIGYPVAEVSEQEWREPTGRLTVDWKPALTFTDETLIYGSYARGYKAGGANPPGFVKVYYGGDSPEDAEAIAAKSATKPKTFDAEFVDAFELGAKNTLFDGRVTLNLASFYYDYKGYQISEIVDRSAFNRNFDAEVWGLEIEADWRPLENLRFGFKGGYEKTRLVDGSRAIDLMDRTAGNDEWIVVKPFPTYASNCVLPKWIFIGTTSPGGSNFTVRDAGNRIGGTGSACELAYVYGLDPVTGLEYVANPTEDDGVNGLSIRPGYPGWNPLDESVDQHNNGEGFFKDLSGNELPNAPNFTATLTVDYTVPMVGDWLATVHGDFYYQSEAWWRIFNTEGYDKLKAYTNVNLSAIFTNEEAGWKIMAYVKNAFDRDSITGAFLNSDDSGLTTNVFLTEPRLYGLRVTKEWTGGPLFGNFGARGEGPYPLTVELGGQVQRHDAPVDSASPSFLEEFSPNLRQGGFSDLDWGDGREVKLTYDLGPWRILAGARFGKTNAPAARNHESEVGDTACIGLFKYYPNYCEARNIELTEATNWSQYESVQREKHEVVDFAIGRDFGFGLFSDEEHSSVSLGVRYARLTSEQEVKLYGIPDWDITSGSASTTPSSGHQYHLSVDARRKFDGAGLVLAWDASKSLIGGADTGHVDVDWSVSGGVLFGKQQTSIEGEEKTDVIDGPYFTRLPFIIDHTDVTPIAMERSESISVPVLGVSVGLAYRIDRVMVGAGYRWERYFDAIDGGYDEAQEEDRTIDGPYFKLSVGFGG